MQFVFQMKMKLYQIKELIGEDDIEKRLAESLRTGSLPDCFLYTGDGAQNWLRLDASDEFPTARRLTELFLGRINALIPFIPPESNLLSIGVGSGEKEMILLRHMASSASVRFYAADISRPLVENVLENFRSVGLPAYGIVAFLEDIALLLPHLSRPLLLCLLGNSFCNYEPEGLLSLIGRRLTHRDLFLFDCRLCTSQMDAAEKTYQSPLNVAFNMGPLLNRGMAADCFSFSLKTVPLANPHLGAVWRTRRSVRVLRSGRLRIGRETVSLLAGSEIRMGFTYRFTRRQVESLLRSAGFAVVKQFLSLAREEMIVLACKKQPTF
jgi:uncharacterized SAM-dependent methyltransferase